MAARPTVWRVMFRRELGPLLMVLVGLAATGAVVAARAAATADPAARPLVMFAQVRFDIAVLFIMCVLLVLRTAVHAEADQSSGWLDPLFAAGGSRIEYGLSLCGAAFTTSTLVFAVAAFAFAFAVSTFGGSTALLRALPHTIAGGALVLGAYTVLSGLFAILLRRSVAVVCLVAITVVVPYVLLVRHLIRGGPMSWWLYRLTDAAPPLALPAGLAEAAHVAAQIAVGSVLLTLAAWRRAGRRL